MTRRTEIPLQKHTLNLFEGDFDKLQGWYTKLGASRIVRELVRAQVRRVEESIAQKRNPTVADLDIPVEAVEEALSGVRVEQL